MGKIIELSKNDDEVRRVHIVNVDDEIVRFENAKEKASLELDELYKKAIKEVGETDAAIFEVHQMMLDDEDYLDSIKNIITGEKINAEFAVATTRDNFAHMFASMDDDYMKERAADIRDISSRLIDVLSGKSDKKLVITEPSIIVADDLTPSETVQLDKNMVLAFVTRQGSTNSHSAILARTMNIPALVMTNVPNGVNGKMAIVDGEIGALIVEPSPAEVSKFNKKKKEETTKRELLMTLKGKETATKSGKKINLYANIGSVGDVANVLKYGADGIGLFRSEFLYLESSTYPNEEEQFKVYKSVAQMMAGKKVIIRTLDIGADKQIDYFELDKEENPALGFRAVRICLSREEIFKTQLRALYRASAFGKISIMVPMIISVWEVQKVKEIIEGIKNELDNLNIPYGDVEFGIMIETPAAVVIADDLAPLVDFFSIGTNDLTQYTLAIDRQNQKLEPFYNEKHPAVLKMIQMTIDAGHKANIWVGICGELGANLSLTKKFVEMGIDELSVAPSMVLSVKKEILEME